MMDLTCLYTTRCASPMNHQLNLGELKLTISRSVHARRRGLSFCSRNAKSGALPSCCTNWTAIRNVQIEQRI